MSNGLVTVVIPAYKCENLISRAIESALRQTYDYYELIVVDDGSPDNVANVVKKYKERVQYIRQDNGGVSKARNTGINLSKGEYIAFLDADDAWEKNKLEVQLNILEKHPEISMLSSSFWNTKSGEVLAGKDFKDTFDFFNNYNYAIDKIYNYKSIIDIRGQKIEYYWGDIYDYLFLGNFILPSTVVVRKQSLFKAGLFNENIKVAEETELFLRYSRNNKLGFVNMPLVYYEMPDMENLSGKINTERLMKNSINIKIDSYISNRRINKKSNSYYLNSISNSYSKLAYYFLSEYKNTESRRYSLFAIKSSVYNIKAYVIWLLSYLPKFVLLRAATWKRTLVRRIK